MGRYPDGGKRVYDMAKPTVEAANFISSQSVYIYGDDSNYIPGGSTDINGVTATGGKVRYHTPSGVQTDGLHNGVNIVRDADGRVRKVMKTGF